MSNRTKATMLRFTEQEYAGARRAHEESPEHPWMPFAQWVRRKFLQTLAPPPKARRKRIA